MYALTCLYRRDVQVCTKPRNGVNANDIPLHTCTLYDDACLKESISKKIAVGSCKFIQLAIFF